MLTWLDERGRNGGLVVVWGGGYFVQLFCCSVLIFVLFNSSCLSNQTLSPLRDGPIDFMHHHPNPSIDITLEAFHKPFSVMTEKAQFDHLQDTKTLPTASPAEQAVSVPWV